MPKESLSLSPDSYALERRLGELPFSERMEIGQALIYTMHDCHARVDRLLRAAGYLEHPETAHLAKMACGEWTSLWGRKGSRIEHHYHGGGTLLIDRVTHEGEGSPLVFPRIASLYDRVAANIRELVAPVRRLP